jgi:gamma-glutamyltranspeptidase/glutathione hydrolase
MSRLRPAALAAAGGTALLALLLIACHGGAPAAPSHAQSSQGRWHAIVVTANPLATQAGLAILQQGGSAADAAVTVQAVLGLVEPQSSGLGGGGFITYYDARTRTVLAYNGRETAPAGASPDMFLNSDGTPLPFATAVLSGRSTGVPGAVAALGMLQHEHGRRPWRSLFGAAEQLARDGFIVSPRLAGMIASRAPQASAPDAQRYFRRGDGLPYVAGDLLRNPAYAATLQTLAEQGPSGLYHGRLAQDIVERVHQGELPGTLSEADFARYQPIESAALCHPWQGYRVCAPPPPSGGIGVLEALLLLEHTDIATRGPTDALAWVEFGEAQQLMYADRDAYVADPAFFQVPVTGLLDADYLRTRAALIFNHVPTQPPQAGLPPGAVRVGQDRTREPGGTSEFVIVDRQGNVVSMTTTVESIFGSGRMVDGFFLNNQLTDFSFSPRNRSGQTVANAVAPGKRPRSAMSPTIVFDQSGHFLAATGSAGGPAIIAYVLKTLMGTLDWHLSMQAAIDLPNLVAHGADFTAETALFPPGMLQSLIDAGMQIRSAQYEESGLQGVLVRADGSLEGGADPRREGIALGY